MWKRHSPEEIGRIARRKDRSRKNPKSALLFALVFSIIAFVFWTLGAPGKYNPGPSYPKSWEKIVQQGPMVFACTFGFLFVMLYFFQRRSSRAPEEPDHQVLICPECHVPQHAHDRRCTCTVKMEPLENWKWS
jgi:hypothetical protein